MKTIRSLHIVDFQSHKDTYMEFSGGFNVITGPSDHGKTAVIRALKWLLYNEPRGIGFIRHGASKATVTLTLADGTIIRRERSKSLNRYVLKDETGKEWTFEGFGNEVPQEIEKAHGVPRLLLDRDIHTLINLGEQLEGPFLLSETGAARAKAIGRTAGIHIIDSAIRTCMSDEKRESQSMEQFKKELEQAEKELAGLEYLDEIGKGLERYEEIKARIKIITGRIESLVRWREENSGILLSIERQKTEAARALQSIKEYEIQLKRLLKEAGKCPLCGSTIPSNEPWHSIGEIP